MDELSHKGFRARIDFDAEDALFVGHLIGVDDIVGFLAESVEALQAAFEEAVEDYIAIRVDQDRRGIQAQLLEGACAPATAPVDETYFEELRQRAGRTPLDSPASD